MGENELDLELVKRVQRGDKTAFDLLVRKYQHRIGAVVYRFVPDHAECQDITQDAFIRAYRALGNFRGDSQFYTWLYRIAVNTAKNHLVAMKRRPPTSDVEAEDAEHYAGASRMHDHDTPEHELLREEIAREVSATVAAITASAGSVDLRAMAFAAGVSLRQLERRFLADVGMPPKTFARIVRLQAALTRIAGGDSLADAAHACGYYDQPHMTRDFARLAETSPAAWQHHAGHLTPLFVKR